MLFPAIKNHFAPGTRTNLTDRMATDNKVGAHNARSRARVTAKRSDKLQNEIEPFAKGGVRSGTCAVCGTGDRTLYGNYSVNFIFLLLIIH